MLEKDYITHDVNNSQRQSTQQIPLQQHKAQSEISRKAAVEEELRRLNAVYRWDRLLLSSGPPPSPPRCAQNSLLLLSKAKSVTKRSSRRRMRYGGGGGGGGDGDGGGSGEAMTTGGKNLLDLSSWMMSWDADAGSGRDDSGGDASSMERASAGGVPGRGEKCSPGSNQDCASTRDSATCEGKKKIQDDHGSDDGEQSSGDSGDSGDNDWFASSKGLRGIQGELDAAATTRTSAEGTSISTARQIGTSLGVHSDEVKIDALGGDNCGGVSEGSEKERESLEAYRAVDERSSDRIQGDELPSASDREPDRVTEGTSTTSVVSGDALERSPESATPLETSDSESDRVCCGGRGIGGAEIRSCGSDDIGYFTPAADKSSDSNTGGADEEGKLVVAITREADAVADKQRMKMEENSSPLPSVRYSSESSSDDDDSKVDAVVKRGWRKGRPGGRTGRRRIVVDSSDESDSSLAVVKRSYPPDGETAVEGAAGDGREDMRYQNGRSTGLLATAAAAVPEEVARLAVGHSDADSDMDLRFTADELGSSIGSQIDQGGEKKNSGCSFRGPFGGDECGGGDDRLALSVSSRRDSGDTTGQAFRPRLQRRRVIIDDESSSEDDEDTDLRSAVPAGGDNRGRRNLPRASAGGSRSSPTKSHRRPMVNSAPLGGKRRVPSRKRSEEKKISSSKDVNTVRSSKAGGGHIKDPSDLAPRGSSPLAESSDSDEWSMDETRPEEAHDGRNCLVLPSDFDATRQSGKTTRRKAVVGGAPKRTIGSSVGFGADELHGPAFFKARDRLTVKYFSEFNEGAFSGELSGVKISWSQRLNSTAGVTKSLRRTNTCGRQTYISVVELSAKVVDSEPKLRETLLHELCHAAAWVIDHKSKPPHGKHFWAWANRAKIAHPGVPVTTCHSYEINYKYRYVCLGTSRSGGFGGDKERDGCGAEIGRHSKSIDVVKQVCGRCKGRLILFGTHGKDGKLKKPRAASTYSLFVKEHYAEVKATLPAGMKQQGVMKELSKHWKARDGKGAGGAASADITAGSDAIVDGLQALSLAPSSITNRNMKRPNGGGACSRTLSSRFDDKENDTDVFDLT